MAPGPGATVSEAENDTAFQAAYPADFVKSTLQFFFFELMPGVSGPI